MDRNQTIQMLQTVGNDIAKEFGFLAVEIGEDRQKGFWGSDLTEYLEKTYGECTKEIKWYDKSNPRNYVEFRFRFANPVLSIYTFDKGDRHENLASMEFTDSVANWITEDDRNYVQSGEFYNSERQIWGDRGFEYLNLLIDKCAEYEKNFQKEAEISDLEIEERQFEREKLADFLQNCEFFSFFLSKLSLLKNFEQAGYKFVIITITVEVFISFRR